MALYTKSDGTLAPVYTDVNTGEEYVKASDVLAISSARVALERVLFNPPATIVFWSDGTKTVVKAKNEPFDREKGLAMAICKKTNGNKGSYFNVFRKWCREEGTCRVRDPLRTPCDEPRIMEVLHIVEG